MPIQMQNNNLNHALIIGRRPKQDKMPGYLATAMRGGWAAGQRNQSKPLWLHPNGGPC